MHYEEIRTRVLSDVSATGAAGVEAFMNTLDAAIDGGAQPAKGRVFTGWELALSSYGEDPLALAALVQEMVVRAEALGMARDAIATAYESVFGSVE